MGALKIDCYCSEQQMRKIIGLIVDYLNEADRSELCDIDEVVGDIRICVDFEVYMDSVRVKASEILDDDWEILYEDTAVLTSRLKPIIEAYNRNYYESRRMAQGIRADQLAELGINVTI